MISYELIRSKRKTVSIRITPEGNVQVRAPLRCPRSYIDQFVREKQDWILSHQAEVRTALAQRSQWRIRAGDTLMFCGEPYEVVLTGQRRGSLDMQAHILVLPDAAVDEVMGLVERLYRRGGLPWIQERLAYWAGIMQVTYGTVSLSSAMRRWGSCSSNGNIHISWLLLFAPQRAIDYVLVHELCHRIEFNHSRAFWAQVARYMPDYVAQKKALAALQQQLFVQGWSKK